MPQPTDDLTDSTLDSLEDYSQALKETEEVLRECFQTYSLDEVFLSFNGGKDCTVLLDILINLAKDIHKGDNIAERLKIFYIRNSNPFSELEDFVEQTGRHYGLRLSTKEGDIKGALRCILAEDPALRACLMGTRRTDPHCQHLTFMQETDAGWPRVVRVSPLLNWTYGQIWSYIRQRGVPYCCLYDVGYTSIGSTVNTRPNPHLRGAGAAQPAWRLRDAGLERAGRGAAFAGAGAGRENGTDAGRLCVARMQ